MFSYITENTYITIETMHYEMRGLNFVCRYRDYEEKYAFACAIIKQAEVSTCFPRTYTGFILQGLHHPGDLQAVEVPE